LALYWNEVGIADPLRKPFFCRAGNALPDLKQAASLEQHVDQGSALDRFLLLERYLREQRLAT